MVEMKSLPVSGKVKFVLPNSSSSLLDLVKGEEKPRDTCLDMELCGARRVLMLGEGRGIISFGKMNISSFWQSGRPTGEAGITSAVILTLDKLQNRHPRKLVEILQLNEMVGCHTGIKGLKGTPGLQSSSSGHPQVSQGGQKGQMRLLLTLRLAKSTKVALLRKAGK